MRSSAASQLVLGGRGILAHAALAAPALAVFVLQRAVNVLAAWDAHGDEVVRKGLNRWDAGWYVRIAQEGYSQWPPVDGSGAPLKSDMALFPLLPLLGRAIAALSPASPGSAVLAVALAGGLLAAWGIFAVGNHLHGRQVGVLLVALWGMSPQSFVLAMGYAEGAFTAAAAWALYFVLRDRPLLAGIASGIGGLLRPTGLVLLVVVVAWCFVRGVQSLRGGQRRPWTQYLMGAVLAASGLISYLLYVAWRTGSLVGYVDVQETWGHSGFRPWEVFGLMWRSVSTSADWVPGHAAHAVIIAGYLLLTCLLLAQLTRQNRSAYVWVIALGCGMVLMGLSNPSYFNSMSRQLLVAFPLLIPLARIPGNRVGWGLAVAVGTLLATAWGVGFVTTSNYQI